MARPTKYEPYLVDLVFWMAQAGLTDKEMAAEMEIAESTFHKWKQDHPEFSESIKRGKETPDDEVEAALLRKAKGFKFKEGGRERVALPDTTACIFWLKNRRPAMWRDKHEIASTGDITLRVVYDDDGDRTEDPTA